MTHSFKLTTARSLLFVFTSFSSGETNRTTLSSTPDLSEEYPYILPFLAQDAIDQGFERPLPVGIGLSHRYAKRVINVTGVRAGINNPGNDVSSQLDVDVNTEVNTTVLRLDAWIFPFMNVYGFTGHVDNKAPVVFTADLSGIGGSPNTTINSRFDLDGPTYGGGVVLAGGLADYFMTLDANFFKADLTGTVSEEFTGSTYSARAGWNGEIKGHPSRFWLGISYWKTESKVSGSIPLGGLLAGNSIEFEVDQEPENPSNFNLGGYVELTRKIHLIVDLGSNFDDATTILAEMNYRFF